MFALKMYVIDTEKDCIDRLHVVYSDDEDLLVELAESYTYDNSSDKMCVRWIILEVEND